MIGKASEKSRNDNWWTPDPLYESICRMTNIFPELDVAADEKSRKCKYYFTKEDDALTKPWLLIDESNNSTRKWRTERKVAVWCNPPGKQVQKFVDRAYDQWSRYNIDIVMLIPVNTITNKEFERIWTMAETGDDIYIMPLFGVRPKFLMNGQVQKWASRNGYIVLVFKRM